MDNPKELKLEDLHIGMKVYHLDVYWGREQMEIVGLRRDQVELEGDWSGGTHNVCQKSWMPIKGVVLEKQERS